MLGRMCVLVGSSMLLVSTSVFPVYAQSSANCSACSKTPKTLQKYIDVMYDLIDLLPVDALPTEKQEGAKEHQPTIFTRDKDKINTTVREVIGPYYTSPIDIFAEIELTFASESLLRDHEKLSTLQHVLAERISMLHTAHRHDDALTQETIAQIDNLIKKLGYMRLKKIDSLYRRGPERDGETYTTFAKFLRELHHLYDEMHKKQRYRYYHQDVGKGFVKTEDRKDDVATAKRDKESVASFARVTRDLFDGIFGVDTDENALEKIDFLERYLVIEDDYVSFWVHVREIHDEYACSVGLATNQCLTTWQQARKDMSYLFKERIGEDAERAKDTFESAWSRLKGTLGRGTDEDEYAATQRKKSLTKSYRGGDIPSKQSRRDIVSLEGQIDPAPATVSAMWKRLVKSHKAESDGLQTPTRHKVVSNGIRELSRHPFANDHFDAELYPDEAKKRQFFQEQRIAQDVNQRIKETYNFVGNNNIKQIYQKDVENLQNTFLDVLALQDQATVDDLFTDVNRTTHRFPALSFAVHQSIQLLGDKNDKEQLYHAMGFVCDKQCQNLDGHVCWGDED